MTVNAFLRIVLICCCLCGMAPACAETRPQSIKVAMDNNYPPYVFADSNGKLQGILIDQWQLWEQKSGIKVEIQAMDWGKALNGMKAGRFDVIDTIFKTEERSKWLDFTQPYARLEVPIFFAKDISGITDAGSLKGFAVAAKNGDAAVDFLKRHGVDNLVLFNSYEDVILAAKEHKITVFVIDKPPAVYFLHKFGINENYKQSAPLNVGEFHRAVKKNNSELLKIVEAGFHSISSDELEKIDRKWYGSAIGYSFPTTLLVGIGGLFLLLLAMYAWNRILHRTVNARIEELKNSEEKFRKSEELLAEIIELSPISMAIVCMDGTIEFINRRAIETFGYFPEDIPDMDRWWAQAYPDETYRTEVVTEWMALVGKAIADKQEIERREYRVTCKDGTIKTTIIFGIPVASKVFVIFDDITERKKAEMDRLNLERQLLHAQKLESLGVLSGGIAHDFNNLLQALLGNLDLALKKLPEDTPARTNISQAIKAGTHAAKLTNMMLAYSGKGLFIVKPLDLTALVEENAAMLETAISKSATLELHLDHALPPILADAGQLQQVIMNLMTNASEAIGDQGGTIRLSTGVREFDQTVLNSSRLEEKLPAGRYVWMKVCDNGCGMDMETLQKLFDPFFTTKFTGRGLGMSAVQGIIRAHKGAFLVESTPGAGTTIQVLLPILDHTTAEQAHAPDTAAGASSSSDQLRTVILVIDDEDMIRGVCVAMLEELGFEALSAATGEEGLRIFREQRDRISLVLLDQVMPGMDGVAVFKELQRIRPEIKVLLASGFSEQEVAERFKGLGLNGFIPKPFNLKRLNHELQQVLERNRDGQRT